MVDATHTSPADALHGAFAVMTMVVKLVCVTAQAGVINNAHEHQRHDSEAVCKLARLQMAHSAAS